MLTSFGALPQVKDTSLKRSNLEFLVYHPRSPTMIQGTFMQKIAQEDCVELIHFHHLPLQEGNTQAMATLPSTRQISFTVIFFRCITHEF